MALTDYIETLKQTKTYEAGLISIQEYSFKSRMLGLVRSLPSVPHADDDRHVVVMEILGDQPNILTVLREKNQTFHPTTKDVNKLLFVFVEMRPHTLVIEKSRDGYRLGDGHQINAEFNVTYKVENAKEFWGGNKDQLADFESALTDAAKNFFLGKSSRDLIISPANLKQSLEKHISDAGIKNVKTDLEESIRTCKCAGISLDKVVADVYLSDSLHEFLNRLHIKTYEEGGSAERYKINQDINSDTTFAPYKLRDVINALDIRLFENFYSMRWSDAMRLVTERLAEKKQEFMMSLEQKELKRMRDLIDAADDLGLDPMDVESLKSKLAGKLMLMADNDSNSHSFSDGGNIKDRYWPLLFQ